MKTELTLLIFLYSVVLYAQDNDNISSTRKIIENAETTRINKDWSQIAEFRSGIGETVQFFPVQVVNLKTGEKENALQMDMAVKMKGNSTFFNGMAGALTGNNAHAIQAMMNDGIISSWIGYNEIDEFISFIEQQIIPNMDVKYKDKSSEFIFNAEEMTLKFLIREKTRRLTISLNNVDFIEFWTESRADNIGELLPILKSVKNKELKF